MNRITEMGVMLGKQVEHSSIDICLMTYLKSHKFVIGFGSPGVNLHGILHSDHEKFDPLVFHWKVIVFFK